MIDFLTDETIVFSHHLKGFAQHGVEWLLLSCLDLLEWGDLSYLSKNKPPDWIIGYSCLSVQVLISDQEFTLSLDGAQRLVQKNWQADESKILPNEVLQYLPDWDHSVSFQVRQLVSLMSLIDEDPGTHECFVPRGLSYRLRHLVKTIFV